MISLSQNINLCLNQPLSAKVAIISQLYGKNPVGIENISQMCTFCFEWGVNQLYTVSLSHDKGIWLVSAFLPLMFFSSIDYILTLLGEVIILCNLWLLFVIERPRKKCFLLLLLFFTGLSQISRLQNFSHLKKILATYLYHHYPLYKRKWTNFMTITIKIPDFFLILTNIGS